MSVPESLRTQDLVPLWSAVHGKLEANGSASRGRLRLPPLSAQARLALQAIIERKPAKTLDLEALEAGLIRLQVGKDLPVALAALGYAVSDRASVRRAERKRRQAALAAARAEVAAWPEPWALDWIAGVIRAGALRDTDDEAARLLVRRVRTVLDALESHALGSAGSAPLSRTDLAARLLGSSHALDSATRLEAAVVRALAFRHDAAGSRELWAEAGVHLDLTSAPALTWRLPLSDDCGLAPLANAATHAGVPLHLSRFALTAHPVRVANGTDILVVENPRLVEAAAQMRAATPVISTNGQPASTVLLLFEQLQASRARLHYHGDFDSAGLAICARMMRLGLSPWRMSAADYKQALAAADADGAGLPTDPNSPGPTPWDPELQAAFARERRIVHQERLLWTLLDRDQWRLSHDWSGGP